MAEQRKRLDMTIRADLRDFVEEESQRTGRQMNFVVDELLEMAIAQRRGEVIEQQSLPVIRAIVDSALWRTKEELRAEIREDMHLKIVDALRKATDRVVALVIRTVRDTATIRRLLYTFISKSHSPDFAKRAYDDAREKAGQELAPRPKKEEEQQK
jgi:hypothetical protein